MLLPDFDQDSLVFADAGQGGCEAHFSPEHLRAVAHLYGVRANPVSGARVLELGCGSGAHLIALAQAFPETLVVGVDCDPEAVGIGQAFVQAHGLTNIVLLDAGLDAVLQSDLGQFDYIVIRGVFGLLSNDVRQALLAHCASILMPEGLICCQYNTYPGWRAGDTLRDALLLHAGMGDDGAEAQLARARAMLGFLSQGLAQAGQAEGGLQRFVAQAAQDRDDSLALKYLQGMNTPCYLVEFHGMAEQAGLAYVGDAQVQLDMPLHYGEGMAGLCDAINPTRDKILGQQYLDFLVNRTVRCSLLARSAHAADSLPAPDLSRLRDFLWSGQAVRQEEAGGGAGHGYRSRDDGLHTVSDQGQQAVLDALSAAWPMPLGLESLMRHCQNPAALIDGSGEDGEAPWQALQALFLQHRLGLRFVLSETGRADGAGSRGLLARPGLILAGDASRPDCHRICNGNYETWRIPQKILDIASLFDGDADIVDVFARYAASPGVQGHDGAALASRFCRIVDMLRRCGVLRGSRLAWAGYFRFALGAHAEGLAWLPYLLPWLMHGVPVPGLNDADPSFALIASVAASRQDQAEGLSRPWADALQQVWSLHCAGDGEAALAQARLLAQRYPRQQNAWKLMALVLMGMDRDDLSCMPAIRAMALASTDPDIYYILVNALWKGRRSHVAAWLAQWLLPRFPDSGPLWNVLGMLRRQVSDVYAAERFCRHAIDLMPEDPDVMSNLGSIVCDLGDMRAATGLFEQALALAPEELTIRSNYLFALLHSSHISPEDLFAQHQTYGWLAQRRAQQLGQAFSFDERPDPDRPLRLGFVSADLRNHAVSSFIENIWHDLDKTRFSIHAYSNSLIHDDVSERLKQSTAQWRAVAGMDDSRLAQLIYDDGVDVLIDLSGHTAGTRLPMLAFKPAPVQMGWIGYPCTTGLAAMDYHLVDSNMAAPGELEAQFTEALIYLRPSASFDLDAAPSQRITAAPCLSNGHVTFASLNRPRKLNDEVFQAWAAVLTQVPDARMIIGNMSGERMSAEISARLQALGVRPGQLSFRQHMGWSEYIQLHGEIDILLDTFPYSGGTTSCNAVVLGIPTITLEGRTLVGRQGSSLMKSVGLEEFIARSVDDYVALGVKWGRAIPALARIRAGYRSGSTGRADSARPAFFFEFAMREAWRRFCAKSGKASFSVGPGGEIVTHTA